MQVRRVWSRAARSLLAQRTRAVPVKTKADGRSWRWRWSLGAEPNDVAVLEARQYLAADLDVEAMLMSGDVSGPLVNGKPTLEVYDPHGLAKQRIVTTPSLGVEVKLAVSARWMDRAHRGRRLVVRLGSKTRATAEPLARKGYQVARDRVTQAQAVKHLRRSFAPAPDLNGTHTVRANLTFTPAQGVCWEVLREQLVRAGVRFGPALDDVPGAKVDGAETKGSGYTRGGSGLEWSDLRFPLVRPRPTADPRRCIDPDNIVHLVHPFLALPLCGKPLKHEERGKNGGARVFYTAGAEGMADDSRMCDVCVRMSAALSEPPVDPELWRSASPVEREENNQLFAEALGDRAHHAFKDAAAALGSCPGCSRAYGADGVSCHRTPAEDWHCHRSPAHTPGAPVEEVPAADPGPTRPDASPELDDGDEMPVLLVTFDARVYLPKLMVEAGMVTSQKNGARLINSGQVTIDGRPCVGKLTYSAVELVGFVVELGGPNTTGGLPRIYESMTRRFRVLMA